MHPYDANLISLAECKLHENLDQTTSVFCMYAQEMLNRFPPKTNQGVRQCVL
jgi:hypothetical protein